MPLNAAGSLQSSCECSLGGPVRAPGEPRKRHFCPYPSIDLPPPLHRLLLIDTLQTCDLRFFSLTTK